MNKHIFLKVLILCLLILSIIFPVNAFCQENNNSKTKQDKNQVKTGIKIQKEKKPEHSQIYNSPFELKLTNEIVAFSVAAAMFVPTFFIKTDPLSDSEIMSLNKDDINGFDRSAANNWNTTAKSFSDITVITCAAAPLLLLAGKNSRSDILTAAVMYAEVMALSFSLGRLTKKIVNRTRPFVYNSDAPMRNKKEEDARYSFFSGHTITAFSSAAFLSYTFSQYYPNSPWKYVIWPVSFSLAGLTAYLRIAAGKHFPTDTIVGAAVGTLIGILIPYLHRTKKNQNLSIVPFMGENNGVQVTYYF